MEGLVPTNKIHPPHPRRRAGAPLSLLDPPPGAQACCQARLHVTGHRLALSAATVGILATPGWKHGCGAQGAKLQPDLSVAWASVELCPGRWICPGRYRNLLCLPARCPCFCRAVTIFKEPCTKVLSS